MAARLTVRSLPLGIVAAVVGWSGCSPTRLPPVASFPAQTSIQCYTPGPDDYAVVIIPHDTTFVDSAWLRPMLEGIGRNWPVEVPLPRRSVDVGATILRDGAARGFEVKKRSGSSEFDLRAVTAVTAALTNDPRPLPERFLSDSLPITVRFGAKDMTGAFVQTWLSVALPPRPRRSNPEPDFPVERTIGQQVLVAFTVDSMGGVDPSTIEVISSTDDDYTRAVLAVLPRWRFTPSMVRGCRVARPIRWEFGRPVREDRSSGEATR